MDLTRLAQPVTERMKGLFGPYLAGPMRLNLGSARNHEPGFLSLDLSPNVGADVVWDLDQTPLPFEADTFDCILGAHVFEHVRAFVPLVTDLHRILKPGGFLISVTPHGASDDAWDNPFHVRGFGEMTWAFFNQALYHQPHAGNGDFGIDFTLKIVETRLVPYEEYAGLGDEALAFAVRRYRNVLRELQVVMVKEDARHGD